MHAIRPRPCRKPGEVREKEKTSPTGTVAEIQGALTISNFCQTYGVGRTFAYAEIAAGMLMAKKAGRRTVIPRKEAERWLTALPASHRRHLSVCTDKEQEP